MSDPPENPKLPNIAQRWKQFYSYPEVRWMCVLPGALLQMGCAALVAYGLFWHESGLFVKILPLPFGFRYFVMFKVMNVVLMWYFIATGVKIAPKYPLVVGIALPILFSLGIFAVQVGHGLPPRMSYDNASSYAVGVTLGLMSARAKQRRLDREQEEAKKKEKFVI